MPAIGYNIRKNLKNWLKEKSKNVDVRPRNVILHHFGHNVTCSQKIGFTCLLNRNYMQKSEKINAETLRKLKLQPYTVMLSPIQNYPLSPIFKAVFSHTSQLWKRYKRDFTVDGRNWIEGYFFKVEVRFIIKHFFSKYIIELYVTWLYNWGNIIYWAKFHHSLPNLLANVLCKVWIQQYLWQLHKHQNLINRF